jgi:hypothetical protein
LLLHWWGLAACVWTASRPFDKIFRLPHAVYIQGDFERQPRQCHVCGPVSHGPRHLVARASELSPALACDAPSLLLLVRDLFGDNPAPVALHLATAAVLSLLSILQVSG